MKKYIILMMVGAAVLGMTLSASADGEEMVREIVTREVGSHDSPIGEPIIEPVCIDDLPDDVIIAPDEEMIVWHCAQDGERSADDLVISPAPYNGDLEQETIKTSSAIGSVGIETVKTSGFQLVVMSGTVIVLILGFLVMRKK